MPTFLPKLHKPKSNPYMNPHHPSHTPLPKKPAPPATDMLSQARITAGRDPHTGRLSTHPSLAPFIQASPISTSNSNPAAQNPAPSSPSSTYSSTSRSDPTTANNTRLHDLHQVESEERTAYQNRSVSQHHTQGTKYDLFAARAKKDAEEEARRRVVRAEEEERIRRARGGTEYYAPERKVGEYYSGPVEY